MLKGHFMMDGHFIVLVISVISLTGAEVPSQVLPQGIESVYGSDINMGCASPLVDRGGVMVCDGSESYLVDGCSPAIDTNSSNWASQLVTVRKTPVDRPIAYDGVVLTFDFDTAVFPTSIELDLFLCSRWNSGANFIYVYADQNSSLIFNSDSESVRSMRLPSSSCGSLSTVRISLEKRTTTKTYHSWHIVVDFTNRNSEWAYVGEVRFLISNIINPGSGMTCTSLDTTMDLTTKSTSTSIEPSATHRSSTSTTSITRSMKHSTTHRFPSTTITTTKTMKHSTTSTATEPIKQFTTPVKIQSPKDTAAESIKNVTSTSVKVQSPELIKNITTSESTPSNVAVPLIVAGLVLLILTTAIVIGLCFIRRHFYLRVQHRAVQNQPCDPAKEQDNNVHTQAVNPNVSEFTNPGYTRHEKQEAPVIDSQYAEVGINNLYPPMKDNSSTTEQMNTQTTISDKDGKEWIGMYNLVTIPTTVESPDYMSFREEKQMCSSPEVPINAKVEKEEGSTQLLPEYADMQIRTPPKIPQKSSELEEYLVAVPTFNEGIVSESINPSDFTCGHTQESKPMEEEDVDPQIYGPIYTVPTIPNDFQEPLKITSGNINEIEELGIGQFGHVFLATTKGLSLQLAKADEDQGMSILVAVKKLKPNPSQIQQENFDKEVKFMSHLKHKNVVRILGVCNHHPAFIMMEYMEEGNLNQFLQKYSEVVEITSSTTQISTSTVVYMASQIASAMKYLASLKFIHRDVATRSCLVGRNFAVKVADLGVNMKHYQSHYYQVQGNRLLPIRWMATECFSGKFSEKSDVWAFGVTMWELFALARDKPYPHLSDEEVIQNALKRRYHQFPSRSEACPLPLYEIMEKCWIIDMTNRVTFLDLHEMLRKHL